jgi:hypothetical protein
MGEVEAEVGKGTRNDLLHDRHTVSLLTDHLVFSQKYRGKVLEGEVAEAAEVIVIDEEKEKVLKTDTLLFIPHFFTLTGSVLKYGV